jgi:co-chaperonin GroES (HSP10)
MDIKKHSYEPNKVGAIRPLGNNVIVSDMNFEHRVTMSGLILPSDDGKNSGIRPRWGKIYAVGPEQHELQVGQYILVSHGRWTRGVKIEVNGEQFTIRKVDIKDILAVSDEPVQDDTMSDKVI